MWLSFQGWILVVCNVHSLEQNSGTRAGGFKPPLAVGRHRSTIVCLDELI